MKKPEIHEMKCQNLCQTLWWSLFQCNLITQGIRGFYFVCFLISERDKQHVNIKEGRGAIKQQGGKKGNELRTENLSNLLCSVPN